MNPTDRIAYAKKNVPRETVISYQNAIGMSMTPQFGTEIITRPFRGIAGIFKKEVGVVVQTIPNNFKKVIVNVIRD